jgi:tripartite-type tricarboxylate transporter receptor subunit TctC
VAGLDIDSWIGIFAPAKTPPEVIARLQREIAASAAEIRPRLEAAGGEMMEVAPDRLNALIRADYDKWLGVIKEAGITLD